MADERAGPVHEIGGASIATKPTTSVVNEFCQVWTAKNVFVTGEACRVSSGWQDPTLTEMAITARACAKAVEQLRLGSCEPSTLRVPSASSDRLGADIQRPLHAPPQVASSCR
jgi:choline dehydrogenase-like flavoprotein